MTAPDIPLTFFKILNFRDIAQSTNNFTGQQLLQPRKLYRSARPDSAGPRDRQRLISEYKLKTIIDLRTPTEHAEQSRKHGADIPPRMPGIEYGHVNLNGSAYSNALIKHLSYSQTAKLYTLYLLGWRKEAISVLGSNVMAARGLAGLAIDSLTHSKTEIAEIFSILCKTDSYPVLIHCTQGKDRTGLVILLVLLLCGVLPEAIKKDYCLSESELESEREEKVAEIRSIGLPGEFADCPEDWTQTVCDHLDKTYGGVEKYLNSCGISAEQQLAVKNLLMTE